MYIHVCETEKVTAEKCLWWEESIGFPQANPSEAQRTPSRAHSIGLNQAALCFQLFSPAHSSFPRYRHSPCLFPKILILILLWWIFCRFTIPYVRHFSQTWCMSQNWTRYQGNITGPSIIAAELIFANTKQEHIAASLHKQLTS